MSESGEQSGYSNPTQHRLETMRRQREEMVTELADKVEKEHRALKEEILEALKRKLGSDPGSEFQIPDEVELLRDNLALLKELREAVQQLAGDESLALSRTLLEAAREANLNPYQIRGVEAIIRGDRKPNKTVMIFAPHVGDQHPTIYRADSDGNPIRGTETPPSSTQPSQQPAPAETGQQGQAQARQPEPEEEEQAAQPVQSGQQGQSQGEQPTSSDTSAEQESSQSDTSSGQGTRRFQAPDQSQR